MTGDDASPTCVALYTWGADHEPLRAAEFRWNRSGGVELVVHNTERGGRFARELYDNGVSDERAKRMVVRDEGAHFMRALLRLSHLSRYRFVDESG